MACSVVYRYFRIDGKWTHRIVHDKESTRIKETTNLKNQKNTNLDEDERWFKQESVNAENLLLNTDLPYRDSENESNVLCNLVLRNVKMNTIGLSEMKNTYIYIHAQVN